MEIITPPKQTFMGRFPRYEPAARDSTAIKAAKLCLRLYFYKIVLGFTEKHKPQYFRFGSAYHKFREVLEVAYKEEQDQKKAFNKAVLAGVQSYGGAKNDPPVGSQWDFLTESKLLASMAVAFKRWQKEKDSNRIEVLAVEQAFDVFLHDGKTRRGGRSDQMLRWSGQVAGRDFKTSSKTPDWYKRTIDPNDQFTGYLVGLSKLSGEHVGLLDVEVLFNTKPTKSRPNPKPTIQNFLCTKTPWQLEKWEEENITVEELIDHCRDKDVWPQNDNEYTCARCPFHSVCRKGTESAQMTQLESEFKQRPWDYKNIPEDD